MTQMQARWGNPIQDIARELGATLPDLATVTSYVLVFGSATASDTGLEEQQTIITSAGLSRAARIEMLEGALAHERARTEGN